MDTMGKISYQELSAQQFHPSWISYFARKLSAFLVYLLQGLPLTPNAFTSFSLLLVAAGVLSLVLLDSRVLFIALSMIGFVFDQIDGTWARLKGQSSEFGKFYDGLVDTVKFFIVDLGFILFYFERIEVFSPDPRATVAFFAAYFCVRELYGLSAFRLREPTMGKRPMPIGLTGSAARYLVIFPAVALIEELLIPYFLASFAMHLVKITQFFVLRYRHQSGYGPVQ